LTHKPKVVQEFLHTTQGFQMLKKRFFYFLPNPNDEEEARTATI
jgi:hypothetical protein